MAPLLAPIAVEAEVLLADAIVLEQEDEEDEREEEDEERLLGADIRKLKRQLVSKPRAILIRDGIGGRTLPGRWMQYATTKGVEKALVHNQELELQLQAALADKEARLREVEERAASNEPDDVEEASA